MKKYIPILKRTRLFAGVGEEEIAAMLQCLQAGLRTFRRGEYILRQGERLSHIHILVQGKLHLQRDDYWGNRSLIQAIEAGETFGEAYAAPDSGAAAGDVVAVEDGAVISFDVKRILSVCPSTCRFHSLVIQNLFCATAEKNRRLMQKLGYLSKRSTREKLIAYLSEEARRQNSGSFEIPFNRQQLADFLSVDRSAMSHELSKMRDDGLLTFERNRFRLNGSCHT